MISVLVRRDPAWKNVPFLLLLAAAGMAFAPATRSLLGGACAMVGFMSLLGAQGHVRTTRLEAGLPVSVRALCVARILALASVLWLPATVAAVTLAIMPGRGHLALLPLQAAAVCTSFLMALQSPYLKRLTVPGWMWAVLYVPFWVLAFWATNGGKLVAPVCLVMSGALFARLWRALPTSFEVVPPGAGASTAARVTVLEGRPGRYWPGLTIVRSVFSWSVCFFLPQFAIAGFGGQWLFSSVFIAFMWYMIRERVRWLWNLPVRRSAVLPVILAPAFLLLPASYFASFHMGRHPRPVPELRMLILEVAMPLACVLAVLLLSMAPDWRRLSAIPQSARAKAFQALAYSVFVIAFAWPLVRDRFAVGRADPHGDLARAAMLKLAPMLPESPLAVAAIALLALCALYALTLKVFCESEYSAKPQSKPEGALIWR
jgi:hypothetical protein